MYLDYSKLEFDKYGRPEVPELELQTLTSEPLGVLSGVSGIKFNIKFTEPSELSFTIAASNEGMSNPLYDKVSGYKLIYTKHYGIYVVMNPKSEADGKRDEKQITARSLECLFATKKFFLENGTFNFWNPAAPEGTILGRILEVVPTWKVGYVSPSLIGRYRTYDSYDDWLLSFVYNNAPQKYRCVFVFDPYERSINVYDADEERSTLPIYLDFDNLLESVGIEELTEELCTAIRPYGADELDVREVNPIGSNWIYDLSHFISNGDIPTALAEKWKSWQRSILNNQSYYGGLVGLRASATARVLAEEAALTDLKGELEDLINQQSVTIQAYAMETTDTGKANRQAQLDEINAQIADKKAEIAAKEASIDTLNNETTTSYSEQIQAIVNELAFENYFTEDEQLALSMYFHEQDLTEETFVATDLNTQVSGSSYILTDGAVEISGSDIDEIELTETVNKTMYTISGGTFKISASAEVSGDIVRGTLEVSEANEFVLSLYAGSVTAGEASASNGMITIAGSLDSLTTDVSAVTENGLTLYKGTSLSFGSPSSTMFLTASVTDYQRYSVQKELYDFAVGVLGDLATPTYEFSVESGNFLFTMEFERFRNELELGKGVHLNLDNTQMITPNLIEVEFSFEDRSDFSLVFSSRFKRFDGVNTLRDMLEKSYSSSRSLDLSKYTYNQAASQVSQVSKFMQDSINAAVNEIVAAANQSVIINGAGIHIGGDGDVQMRIINNMIALTDDGWQTAKLAIGQFATLENGTYFGVNAEVIAGKLVVGNNLIIEAINANGDIVQFKVDSSGAWLYNSTYVMQSPDGGGIVLDPSTGFYGGKDGIFTLNGTTVAPSFIDEDGEIIFDEDGFPEGVNFYLDMDGNAYFRGNIYATDGVFNGTVYATDGEFTGTVYATDGKFEGIVQASDFLDALGNSMMDNGKFDSQYLDLGRIKLDGTTGDISMEGNLNLSGLSSITWGSITAPTKSQFSAYNTTVDSYWHDAMLSTDYYRRDWDYDNDAWGTPYQFRGTDGEDGEDFAGYDWISETTITGTSLSTPIINANEVNVSQAFNVGYFDGYTYTTTGQIGYATGMEKVWNPETNSYESSYTTYGVAMTTGDAGSVNYNSTTPYVIVTDAGARLSGGGAMVYASSGRAQLECGGYAIYVTSKGAFWSDGSSTYALGSSSGSSSTYAVFA